MGFVLLGVLGGVRKFCGVFKSKYNKIENTGTFSNRQVQSRKPNFIFIQKFKNLKNRKCTAYFVNLPVVLTYSALIYQLVDSSFFSFHS
jgi:hypothetical protein